MKTTALRLYGTSDVRLESFDLPPISEKEILCRVVSDSVCMSSYKAAMQGAAHKRVPSDVAENPIIIGHEFCGEIVEVGSAWRHEFAPGQRFTIQPALNYKGSLASPGYSYPYMGGAATYIILSEEVMALGCLLPYTAESFFEGSLAEPMSCIIGAFHASYHTQNGVYTHDMGIRAGGHCAILAGAGPMGLGAIDYALHADRKPSVLVVTDIDAARLERAKAVFPPEEGRRMGVTLLYMDGKSDEALIAATGGNGFDDVFVFAPVRPVLEQADRILGRDGCLNFFAGPSDAAFSATMNFYNVHYASTHIVGTSGGNIDDMRESLQMTAEGKITPACMVTHVGGLNAAASATLNLPTIPGGKKLIYTHISMELTAIADFLEKGKTDPRFMVLHDICAAHTMLWNVEAERYVMEAFGNGGDL